MTHHFLGVHPEFKRQQCKSEEAERQQWRVFRRAHQRKRGNRM